VSAIIRNLKAFYAVYKNKLYNGAFYFSHYLTLSILYGRGALYNSRDNSWW